jgi:hypothetical protein
MAQNGCSADTIRTVFSGSLEKGFSKEKKCVI